MNFNNSSKAMPCNLVGKVMGKKIIQPSKLLNVSYPFKCWILADQGMLKLGNKVDHYNDRTAYISNRKIYDDDRYIWTINYTSKGFTIQNFSSSGGFLFTGSPVDKDGDRTVYGHNNGSIDNSKGDRCYFNILEGEFTDNGNVNNDAVLIQTYDPDSYFNQDSNHEPWTMKWGAYTDHDSDHQVYMQPPGPFRQDRSQFYIQLCG